MARVAGDVGRGVPHTCHSEGRRVSQAGELSLSFEAALVLTMSFVGLGSCWSNSVVGCLEVEVDRRGRDLGPRRLPLHLAAHILVGYFDPVASTHLKHGLFVACRV